MARNSLDISDSRGPNEQGSRPADRCQPAGFMPSPLRAVGIGMPVACRSRAWSYRPRRARPRSPSPKPFEPPAHRKLSPSRTKAKDELSGELRWVVDVNPFSAVILGTSGVPRHTEIEPRLARLARQERQEWRCGSPVLHRTPRVGTMRIRVLSRVRALRYPGPREHGTFRDASTRGLLDLEQPTLQER